MPSLVRTICNGVVEVLEVELLVASRGLKNYVTLEIHNHHFGVEWGKGKAESSKRKGPNEVFLARSLMQYGH